MTDTDDVRDRDELRKLTAAIFGRDPDPDETVRRRLATPTTGPRNVVASEGENPDPGIHFSREDHLRQIALELFHPRRARTDPYTFDVID